MKIRVLIVDDNREFRDVLALMIDSQNDMVVIGKADGGERAIAMTRDRLPDVILMDVKMPIMDGAETTRRILTELPGMKILALSIYANDEFLTDMMRAGAVGYILKGCDNNELLGAISKAADSCMK